LYNKCIPHLEILVFLALLGLLGVFYLFGYIKPFQPELKIAEFDTYKAVYCGLCKQLGRSFGPFSRLTLSYDFTFLAMLGMGLTEDEPSWSRQRCFVNPLKKKACFFPCGGLSFAADAAMIMFYHKVRDNMADDGLKGRILGYLVLPFVGRARKKAMVNHPEVDTILGETMARQQALEAAGCSSVDEASEPTAIFLARLFEMQGPDELSRRVLYRLGYLMGRYVYLCDALDDIESDLKKHRYNPFILAEGLTAGDEEKTAAVRRQAVGSLYLTIAEACKAIDLLEFTRFGPILSNVVHLGMKNSVNQIIMKRRQKDE
jgi:hypothetical protein